MPRWPEYTSRFWSLVDKQAECWIWLGSRDSKGYGRVWYQGRRQRAHRVSYILIRGEITRGLLACHSCDNKLCVNPEHIFLGTQKDNMQDWTRKGKNRLVNDRALRQYGDDNWTRKPEAREQISHTRKQEFATGKQIALRGDKGQIIGTKMVSADE